jgi:hypothetical protein
MAESPTHKERVAGLVGWLQRQGVVVTHASGGLNLPDPERIGRHEPDALGTKDGVIWIGEAKIGSDLADQTSREQFADFSQRQMSDSGSPCPFILCVPSGFDGAARQAVLNSGGSLQNLTVIA